MKRHNNYIKVAKVLCAAAGIVMAAGFTGCKKLIDTGISKTLVVSTNVYTSNGTAEGVVSGIFAKMASPGAMYNGSSSLTLQQGMAADEIRYYGSAVNLFYNNALTNQSYFYWPEIFSELYVCNSAIEGLTSAEASSLTPAIQQQLLGSAKFARAYVLFNAVNLYGDVPLALSTDANVNNKISRSPASTVLNQVVKDLTEAQSLLPDNKYLNLAGVASTERSAPNKQAASALLARVYLYMQDWKNAEAQATSVIGASSYVLEPVLTNVFLKASREAIWQIQPISTVFANADANVLIMAGVPTTTQNIYGLTSNLVNVFETGDNRFTNWVGQVKSGTNTFYYAYKYKQATVANGIYNEYPIMLRLAEQYLIRAEARAQQNNISGAIQDIDAVRTRAGAVNNNTQTFQTIGFSRATINQADLLTAIYRERQVELFTEQGHRWFDLKRTGRLDAVMTAYAPQKGATWSTYKALIPIPQAEIDINPNLKQNPGY